MISPAIREALREIASEKFGAAPVFMTRSAGDKPELRVAKGDLVVYARATPSPGDAVAVDDPDGTIGFERWDPEKGARVKGVIVAAIRDLGPAAKKEGNPE